MTLHAGWWLEARIKMEAGELEAKGVKGNVEPESNTSTEPEIWFQEEERWELTWPIWHMLPRAERKELALKHGYKTIGEFEEYMSLQQAVGNSEQKPYSNNFIYPRTTSDTDLKVDNYQDPPLSNELVEEEGEEVCSDCELEEQIRAQQLAATGDLSKEELILIGGKILILPDELLHKVFAWLPVDTYATLALVSPHWKAFTRTEAVYRRLCERLYLNQSKRRALHVSRFGNSYRTMLENRPRVRAGGGVYVLKYSQVKKIQRDMWTEIPAGAVLESVYYRYLYFQEDGRVLYALTSAPPHEVFRRFLHTCLTRKQDKQAVWGTYEVSRTTVTIEAEQPWVSSERCFWKK